MWGGASRVFAIHNPDNLSGRIVSVTIHKTWRTRHESQDESQGWWFFLEQLIRLGAPTQ